MLSTDQRVGPKRGSVYQRNALAYEQELKSMSRPISSNAAQSRYEAFKDLDHMNTTVVQPRKNQVRLEPMGLGADREGHRAATRKARSKSSISANFAVSRVD